MVNQDVQKKILKAIYLSGGTADTKMINDITQFNGVNIFKSCFHLANRGLIKKKVLIIKPSFRVPPHKLCVYSIVPTKIDKIKKLITEIR